MNKQPFYHEATVTGMFSRRTVKRALSGLQHIIPESIEIWDDEIQFTATADISAEASDALRKLSNLVVVKPFDAEPGDPADLMG